MSQLTTLPSNAIIVSSLKRTNQAGGLLCIGIGIGVLFGWYFDFVELKSLRAGFATMKPNTALCFILLGTAILCQSCQPPRLLPYLPKVARIASLTVFLLGLFTMAEYLLSLDTPLDTLFFDDITRPHQPAGRMSPIGAVSFMLISTALLVLDWETKRKKFHPAEWLATATFLISTIAVLGYLYGVEALYKVAPFTSIALHTSLTLLIASICVFLLRPERGLMAILVSDSPAGLTVRRLLPAALLLPVFLGWLQQQGEILGFYEVNFGHALYVCSIIVCFTSMIWWISSVVLRSELARRNAELEAREIEQHRWHETERLYKEVQKANILQEDFLHNLSHELRTPLNAIVGWTEQLHKGQCQPEEYPGIFAALYRNAMTQNVLINDLLDISRISSGKLKLETVPVELEKTARAAMESLQLSASAKNIRMVLQAEPLLGIVCGDPARLQEVLWNLLSNAVKFTPAGGTVTIDIRRVASQAELRVSDTGEGIDPHFLPHVFERFRQGNSGLDRRHGGLGLGLSIVRHLVELHGGTVEAQSDGPGKGASFRVILPLAARQYPKAKDTRKDEGPHDSRGALHGVRVLIVDDSEDSLELLEFVLKRHGASVFRANSGNAALQILNHERPDAILCDIEMPGKNGYDVIREVRDLERQLHKKRIPAAALTAHAGAEDVGIALAAGFDQHLAKPIESDKLLALLIKLTRNSGPKLARQEHRG